MLKAKIIINHLGYIDTLKSAGLDQAAIYSKAGDSVWAQSDGFNVCFELSSF